MRHLLRTSLFAFAAALFVTGCTFEDNDDPAVAAPLAVEVYDPSGFAIPGAEIYIYDSYASYAADVDPLTGAGLALFFLTTNGAGQATTPAALPLGSYYIFVRYFPNPSSTLATLVVHTYDPNNLAPVIIRF